MNFFYQFFSFLFLVFSNENNHRFHIRYNFFRNFDDYPVFQPKPTFLYYFAHDCTIYFSVCHSSSYICATFLWWSQFMHTSHHFAAFQGRLFYCANQSFFGGRIFHRYMIGSFEILHRNKRSHDCKTFWNAF